jgi:hypothetical protein
MILISDEMFEKLLARAKAVSEEHFRRYVFDHDGMPPEVIELIRDDVVYAFAERYVEQLARDAHAWAEKRDKRAARKVVAA